VPHTRYGACEDKSCSAGNRTRPVQPMPTLYTDVYTNYLMHLNRSSRKQLYSIYYMIEVSSFSVSDICYVSTMKLVDCILKDISFIHMAVGNSDKFAGEFSSVKLPAVCVTHSRSERGWTLLSSRHTKLITLKSSGIHYELIKTFILEKFCGCFCK
jgi:hypothetical protein